MLNFCRAVVYCIYYIATRGTNAMSQQRPVQNEILADDCALLFVPFQISTITGEKKRIYIQNEIAPGGRVCLCPLLFPSLVRRDTMRPACLFDLSQPIINQ